MYTSPNLIISAHLQCKGCPGGSEPENGTTCWYFVSPKFGIMMMMISKCVLESLWHRIRVQPEPDILKSQKFISLVCCFCSFALCEKLFKLSLMMIITRYCTNGHVSLKPLRSLNFGYIYIDILEV